MEKLVFECETITPMFLGGADGSTELRPPSIKAALRFWWRALNGGLPLNELRQKEAEIFGGSGDNEGKSKFNIRIQADKTPKQSSNIKNNLWDSNAKKLKDDSEGVGYLLYPFLMKDRSYFINQKFNVVFTSTSKEILIEISKVFCLFVWFGAIGSRSRRGCGNMAVNSYSSTFEDTIINPMLRDIETKEKLKKYFETAIQQIYEQATTNNDISFSNLTNLKIYIFDPENSYHQALNKLGLNYKNFRSYRQPDYNNVKNFLSRGEQPNTIEKAAFGLPIEYRYRSLNGSNATIEGSNKERQRSASRVIFKVIRINIKNNYQFYPIVLFFNSQLLPDVDRIKIKGMFQDAKKNKQPRRPLSIAQPDDNILNIFLQQLPNKVEVTL